MGFKVMGVEV